MLETFADRFAQEMRLKAVTERRDVDQLTVAKELGVSPATVSRWKSGVVPDDLAMLRIANYFSVTPSWLRYGQTPREAPPDTSPRPTQLPAPDTRAKPAAGRRKKATKRRGDSRR